MKHFKLILALALTAVPLCSRAVDLAPHYRDTFFNGGIGLQLFFVDNDGKKFGLLFNFETTVEAGSGGSVFRVAGFPEITFTLKGSPMPPSEPFLGGSLERYREAARRLLPAWAMNVKMRSEDADPLTLNGWHSFRITYSFESANAYRMQSVTFVNLNATEQMALITASNEQSFDEASQRMWRLIRTWHLLPPDSQKVAVGN